MDSWSFLFLTLSLSLEANPFFSQVCLSSETILPHGVSFIRSLGILLASPLLSLLTANFRLKILDLSSLICPLDNTLVMICPQCRVSVTLLLTLSFLWCFGLYNTQCYALRYLCSHSLYVTHTLERCVAIIHSFCDLIGHRENIYFGPLICYSFDIFSLGSCILRIREYTPI